jgi:glycosyltransferase involved in cell wall biosynthesis
MHIGIVAPCSSGLLADLLPDAGGIDIGCGGYPIAALVRALVERGHRVSVVTLSPDISDSRILRGPKLTYYAHPMRSKRRMRDLYKVERQGLREGIALVKPDVLHAHWTYEFALASLEMGLPTVVTSHDNGLQVLRFHRDLYRLGRLCLQLRVIRSAPFLTAVSPYLAASLRWLAKAQRIEVIPNLVEECEKPEKWCSRVSGKIRIATVLNGWQNLKNPKIAIRAMNILSMKRPNIEMFMYGIDFQESGPAAKWATKKRLARNIHFRGPVSRRELLTELKKTSILLHPSLEESFGMVIVEAMGQGVPVVAGIKSGGVPWVLDEGRAGFLTDVSDANKVAEALLACIEKKEDREKRRWNAYERVRSLFSPVCVAAQYERVYEEALSSFKL